MTGLLRIKLNSLSVRLTPRRATLSRLTSPVSLMAGNSATSERGDRAARAAEGNARNGAVSRANPAAEMPLVSEMPASTTKAAVGYPASAITEYVSVGVKRPEMTWRKPAYAASAPCSRKMVPSAALNPSGTTTRTTPVSVLTTTSTDSATDAGTGDNDARSRATVRIKCTQSHLPAVLRHQSSEKHARINSSSSAALFAIFGPSTGP